MKSGRKGKVEISAWKEAIEKLFADESRKVELGNRAREDVQSYTWTARAQRILQDL